MRDSAGRRFTIWTQAITLTALCLLVIALSGCTNSSPPASTRVINAEQFSVLQKARTQIGKLIQEVSETSNPSFTVAQRNEKIDAVLKKYQDQLPEPVSTGMDTLPKDFKEKFKGTRTGDLLELNKSLSWKEKGGATAYDTQAAWYVADRYLVSVASIYALQGFEKYLAEHTTEEGSKINPANPPENMTNNAQRWFGAQGGGVSVNITFDPATGYIKYILGEHAPNFRLEDASVNKIEAQFITTALDAMREGDSTLLDMTKI